MDVYVSLVRLALPEKSAEFVTGTGGHGPVSFLCGVGVSWVFYWTLLHVVLYGLGPVVQGLVRWWYPKHGTHKVPSHMIRDQLTHSEHAFPLYTFVPVLGDVARKMGISRTCDDVAACGGWAWSLAGMAMFFVTMELMVFLIHWYLLHQWKWGKANLKHEIHHTWEKADELCVWTGYAFEAIDGFSQGMPIVFCQLMYAVPVTWVMVLSLTVGIWTMYIHCGEPAVPWPFMGAGYHFVHHRYNWFNFGFFTIFWDWVFGTLRHPKPQDYEDSEQADRAEVFGKKVLQKRRKRAE